MVPDRFESRAMAHFKTFLQRKNIFAKQSTILNFPGTLTDVLYISSPQSRIWVGRSGMVKKRYHYVLVTGGRTDEWTDGPTQQVLESRT